MSITLSVCLVAATISWLKWKISTRALIYYISKKEYTPPSDKEMKVCTEYVAQEMFKDLFSTRT